MVESSFLKHLLSDDESLSTYLNGAAVSFEDLRRHIFLLQRKQNTAIPDHHYRLAMDKELGSFSTIDTLLIDGLGDLSNYFFAKNEDRIHVVVERFNEWQSLTTYIPPLILQIIYLFNTTSFQNDHSTSLKIYFDKYIMLNARYTTLPYPLIEDMETKVKSIGGFNDLHIHLNGSTETDFAWQEFLRNPDKVYEDLKKGAITSIVLEQLKQESHQLLPKKFYELLLIARKIRQVLHEYIYPQSPSKIDNNSFEELLNEILFDKFGRKWQDTYLHPFRYLVDIGDLEPHNDTAIEGLMYLLVIKEIKENKKEGLIFIFHFYLLILGLSNRLLVQQVHQYGFEQFQKHTLNNLRDQSEKKYQGRFLQMHGNEIRNIGVLEGRFSPKGSQIDNEKLITAIEQGWEQFSKKIETESPLRQSATLTLVAHFIKAKDENVDNWIRHKKLRIELWNRASILIYLIQNRNHYSNIVGIDAASNELDTPPEVFGPVFRRMRRKKSIEHFTYHVGEEFFHLLSGMRAIYEAVIFTGLLKGDRIGHGIAIGICPKKWTLAIGEKILIKKGEHLDNLIFAYFFIESQNIEQLKNLAFIIKCKIHKYHFEIYGSIFKVDEYKFAWQLRQFCPFHVFSADLHAAKSNSEFDFDFDEWMDIQNFKASNVSVNLFNLYHSKKIRSNYDEILEIETLGVFNVLQLEILQLELLKFLEFRKIVIETLPTSNVRISHYKHYSDHHLWNWKKWKEEKKLIPPIVVGSDDTGIFATSIFNEYAHIYCHLVSKEGGKSPADAMTFIDELCENSRKYKFTV